MENSHIFNMGVFMFILSKKKVYIFLSILLVLTVAVQIKDKLKTKQETVETVALPVNNKVIILDAGHGGEDGGANTADGVTEADINLKITLKVQNLLEQAGATVILTRSDENGIYDLDKTTLRQKKVSDIKNRVKIGNESSADIFISIHLNKIPQEQYWGWQTFFKNGNEASRKLAQSLQQGLNESIQKDNKRESLKIENVYIIENVEIPTSIVECGFLSNQKEKEQLQTEEYQNKLAWGIYIGIMDYFME